MIAMGLRLGILRLLAATLAALMLAGCAVSLPLAEHEQPLSPTTTQVFVERFQLSGRLSVRVADRLDSVRIEWVRDGVKETINFFSPFGSQLAQVSASPEGASLTRGEQTEYAKTIGELTQSLLGTAIDTGLLARWVQGLDVSNSVNAPIVTGDRLVRWTVSAEDVRAVGGVGAGAGTGAGAGAGAGAGERKPSGRYATRVTATEGETTVRLFVDQFRPL